MNLLIPFSTLSFTTGSNASKLIDLPFGVELKLGSFDIQAK